MTVVESGEMASAGGRLICRDIGEFWQQQRSMYQRIQACLVVVLILEVVAPQSSVVVDGPVVEVVEKGVV